MFKVGLSSLISSIVREELRKCDMEPKYELKTGHITKEGIMIEYNCAVHDYTGHRSAKESFRRYMILFCGNVNVFVARVEHKSCLEDVPPERWENTSNHDSCWSSDGLDFINRSYFEMCNEVNPDVAPVLLDSGAQIGFLSKMFTKVIITYKQRQGNDYRNELVKVEKVQ